MVVDDEEFCITSFKAMLTMFGIDIHYHVDFCMNGKEALTKYKESTALGFTYQIIFMDFSMPIMDGI